MRRREFFGLVGGAVFASSPSVRAQPSDRRVGVLMGFEENVRPRRPSQRGCGRSCRNWVGRTGAMSTLTFAFPEQEGLHAIDLAQREGALIGQAASSDT